MRRLPDILTAFLQLLDREQARTALAGSNPFAARVLESLDACTGVAPPPELQPLVTIPLPAPPAPAHAVEPPPPPAPPAARTARSPHGARKASAPRKRSAGAAGGAGRAIRFAGDGGGAQPQYHHAGMMGTFQELLGSHLDASTLGELLNGDDARLYALGERVASALPPLDQWEVRVVLARVCECECRADAARAAARCRALRAAARSCSTAASTAAAAPAARPLTAAAAAVACFTAAKTRACPRWTIYSPPSALIPPRTRSWRRWCSSARTAVAVAAGVLS